VISPLSRELALINGMDREEELSDEILGLREMMRDLTLLEQTARTRLREVRRAEIGARLHIPRFHHVFR